MIGHDDETEQEEWVKLLHAVQRFNGFPGKGRIFKDGFTKLCIRRNQHNCFVLRAVIFDAAHGQNDDTLFWSGKMPDQCQAGMPGLK